MDTLRETSKRLLIQLSTSTDVLHNILLSFGIMLVFWCIHRIILHIVHNQTEKIKVLYQWKKGSSFILTILALLIIGRVWFQEIESLATVLGLVSAGILIALKDVIMNIAGWVYIVWERPFNQTDRIQIGSTQGDVIDIGLFNTKVLEIGEWVDSDQSTGRLIYIPNAKVFQANVMNFSGGTRYIWDEMPVMVTYESHWKKAKSLLEEIINEYYDSNKDKIQREFQHARKKMMIKYDRTTPIIYTSLKDSGITLTIRYLCPPRQRRDHRHEIWEKILEAFINEQDVDFAYPTQRLYDMTKEGKHIS